MTHHALCVSLSVLCLSSLAAGCVGPTTASTEELGASKALVVGVHVERVVHSSGEARNICKNDDWRVSFTTAFNMTSGTYVYDTNTVQEYSVHTNDTALLTKLKATMRDAKPAILEWHTVLDPGCEYQHAYIAIGVLPIDAAKETTNEAS